MATITGTANNDPLIGGAEDDTIDGLAGDDSIDGGAGDDLLIGGTGTDTYVGGEGYDTVWFEDATQGVSANLVTGVIENDGFGNAETISEVEGINGSQFGDVLNAGGGYVVGRAGNDNLTANWVNGGSGNDTLVGSGSGAHLDYWDDGFDPAGVSAQGVVVNLTTGSATDNWGNTDQLSGFANVSGSFYADQITGDTSANDLFGDSGNDTLDGGAGDDFLIGGTGTDTYIGGEGDDTVWFGDATQGVRANLVTGVIQNDGFGNAETISGVEGINGSRFGDVLNAGGGYVIGSAGSDNLTANWVSGGSGNDTLVGSGSGANLDYWDNGFDPAGVTAQGVVVNLTTGFATDNWGNTDRLSGFANVSGSFYADRITGNTSANDLFGDSGNDTLDGGAGNDYLDGWDGNDSLIGGAGNDYLSGGGGNDTMLGGTGSDTFESGAGDDFMNGGTITDPVNLSDLNLVTYAFASGAIDLNLQTGTAQDGDGGTDTLVNINFVEGSEFDDSITGTIGTLFEQFEGLAGNDTIDGGVITSTNNGFNRVTYLQAPAGIDANLATGVVQDGYGDTDTLFNIQSIRGSNQGDNMVGSDTTAWTEHFEGRAGDDTINGAGGVDFVRYDAATTGVNVNFATGVALDDGQGGTDFLSNIEGVRGSSHGDTLSGGNVDNDAFEFFLGGAGNDAIDGGSGYDRVDYTTAQAAATVTLGGTGTGSALDGQGGTDTLINVEAVRGSSFNDRLTGSDSGAFESFEGMAGNDTIDGKGGTDDRADYVGSAAAVRASLLTGVASDGFGGTDRLLNIENLGGSSFGDALTGGVGANRIDGRGGNDAINGAAGNDSLDGGEGSDLYLVGAVGHHIAAEFFDSGTGATDVDEVRFTSAVASMLNLFAGDTGIERVVIGTGTGVNAVSTGTIALNVNATDVVNALEIVGNAGANQLIGTGLNDTLKGGAGADRLDGGQGADSMQGGSGNDTYVVDVAGDLAVEAGTVAGGIDTVESSTISVVLNDVGANLENITLIGSSDIDGTGNAVANTIKGNSGANQLVGGLGNDNLSGAAGIDTLDGGIGSDTLLGGAGDDTYVVDATTDRVYETTTVISTTDAGGVDLVLSGVNWTLGSFVENLTLTGVGNTTGTGNALGNQINGNSGNNVINGAGGNDSLDGGEGSDLYLVGAVGHHIAAEFFDSGTGATDVDEVRFTSAVASMLNLFAGDTGIERVVIGTGTGVNAVSTGTIALNVNATDVVNALEIVGNAGANQLIGTGLNDTLKGGAGADRLDGGQGADSMEGGSGNDTYVVENDADVVVEAARQGTDLVRTRVTYALSSNVENLTLEGADAINGTGNELNNTLLGNSGANRLDGAAGNDSLLGGAGSDTLTGGQGNDTLDGGVITDTVNLSDINLVSYADATDGIVLNLQTGKAQDGEGGTDSLRNINFVTGSAHGDVITGSVSNLFEQFEGMAGNDTINGGQITSTAGGTNRVTYIQAPGGINANLGTGQVQDGYGGTDTLINIQSIRGSNQHDTFLGSGTTAWTENFEGRVGNDTIDGAGGIDLVRYDAATVGVNVNLATGVAEDGQGGTDTLANIEGVRGSVHDDTLIGGNPVNGNGAIDGFEFFLGGAGNDTINGGAGYDRVDYTTSSSAAVVTLGGSSNGTASDGLGGTDTLTNIEAVRATALNDTLTGSDTAEYESFEGMAGNDTINGMGGTDRADYAASAAAVQVSFLTGVAKDGFGGTDTLLNIENLGGSAFNDSLTGNAGANRLDGRAGADSMTGGLGDDTYVVDNVGDRVTESEALVATGGNDSVEASISYTLGVNVENLTLTGAANLNGTGNALANFIQGNAGNNVLNGAGGNDTLFGGDGNDLFRFASTLNASTNLDRIDDFVSGQDRLQLENAIFTRLTSLGVLNANNFVAGDGVVAGDANDFILYDTSTGVLSYDRDGNGAAQAVAFAELVLVGAPPPLSAADLMVT